jgi:hypothetical protein
MSVSRLMRQSDDKGIVPIVEAVGTMVRIPLAFSVFLVGGSALFNPARDDRAKGRARVRVLSLMCADAEVMVG